MNRTQKEDLVAELNETFAETTMVVVTHYLGLTVAEMSDLRVRMRESGASFKVTKNRLTRLALKDTKFESLNDLFKGPTAIAYSNDPVAAAKVSVEFSKQNDKLVVLGGCSGSEVLDAEGIKALAALPSLDQLRGKIVGLLQAPASKVVQVIQAPGAQFARVVSAYSKERESAA